MGRGTDKPRHLKGGWNVDTYVDDDNHLNIYITNSDGTTINDIDTGQGDGVDGEQLALRLTTEGIEKEYAKD